MRIDYSRPIKSIPAWASRESGDNCLLYSRRYKDNIVLHYAKLPDGTCYRITEPYYMLLKGEYKETYSEGDLHFYNHAENLYPSIFNAIMEAYTRGTLPRKFKKKYKEVFRLLLEGCINVNAVIFGLGSAGFKTYEEPVYRKPLVKITKENWLASIISDSKISKAEYNKLYYRRIHGTVIDRCSE